MLNVMFTIWKRQCQLFSQAFEWLDNPILEWQLLHMCNDSVEGGWYAFLLSRLAVNLLVRESSAFLISWCIPHLHFWRSSAISSQLLMLMFAACSSRLQASLNRSWGRPLQRVPWHSSPYKMSLGIRPSSIRLTRPSQRRRRFIISNACMLGIPAWCNTSLGVLLSCCHLMARILLKHRRWKLFSLFSWMDFVFHDSLPYKRVLSTQACYTFILCYWTGDHISKHVFLFV